MNKRFPVLSTRHAVLPALCGALCAFLAVSVSARAAITTESLLDEMTDLERLARWPSPAYTNQQASSWDRKSKTAADYEGWFANADRGHYLRIEEKDGRQEHVMMDADGPGAIVRIWSADPRGTLRFYIDGDPKPAIEAPMQDVLGGKFPGWPTPIAGMRARGWNLYFPIAYAKHCTVTCDTGGFYYHVNYRTYEKGADVKSFAPEDLTRLSAKIGDVAKKLENPRSAARLPSGTTSVETATDLAPGGESKSKFFELTDGPKAIVGLLVTTEAKNLERALRAVVLLMTFDGEKTVECPLGDFFATAPGLNRYASLPVGVSEIDGKLRLWSHWWMPFARTAKIALRNLGEEAMHVHFRIALAPYAWDDSSLLFHAGWRIERDIPSRPFVDWTHLDVKGKGRFVGGALHIINPVKNWWGEGDEKIFVDGETFPSTFGTGSEDYYGYAWSNPELYTHAYHNQPRCDGPGTYGNNLESRFHVLDDIPFTRSFKFDMESWHHREDVKTTRAAVSFWYARPGGTSAFQPLTKADVRLDEIGPYQPRRVADAIEGEALKVIEKTDGDVRGQNTDDRFSSESVLRWQATKPGDRLRLAFEAPEAGRRHVKVRMMKAPDFGIVQLHVNGAAAGEPIDLYGKSSRGEPTEEIDLGAFSLKEGANELTIEIVGTNPASAKKFIVGLDYVLVK